LRRILVFSAYALSTMIASSRGGPRDHFIIHGDPFMSTQTLSSVAMHVVGQYSQVGQLIVGAYRTGARRVLDGANTRYAASVNASPLPLVNEAVKASLIDAQQQIASFVEGGISSASAGAEQAIEMVAGGVDKVVQRIAVAADRVEAAFGTTAIRTVGILAMPAAQVSLEMANRAIEGMERLSARYMDAGAEVIEVPAAARRPSKAGRRIAARA
jgi:hypothetical protein